MSRVRSIRNMWLFYMVSDIYAVVAAYFTTMAIRFDSGWGEHLFGVVNKLLGVQESADLGEAVKQFYHESAPRIILILAVTLCFLYGLLNLYAGRRFIFKRPIAWNVILASAAALAIFYCYFYVRRNMFHPRTFFATVMFLNVFFCVGFRALMDYCLQIIRGKFHVDECSALLVGASDEAELLNEYIEAVSPHGIRIAARIQPDEADILEGIAEQTAEHVERLGVQMVICAEPRLDIPTIMRIVELSKEFGVVIKILTDKMGVLISRADLPFDIIHGMPLVHFGIPQDSGAKSPVSRVASCVLVCLSIAVLAPLWAVIVLLIRMTSSGPAIFVQERLGMDRKPFKMYKFRTMHALADEVQTEMEAANESGEGLFKIRRDPRVTLVGRFLRRFSLDELPQLVNVLRGEMALVGPRPLPWRDFRNYYEDWHYARHAGLPGLTCLWQVSGRSDIDFHDMCILDVYYLRNINLMFDLKILLKTIRVVLFAKGAY